MVPAHILGADWGFDTLFCRAATIYRRVYMKKEFMLPLSGDDVLLKERSVDMLLDSLDGDDGGHRGLVAGSSCLLILRGLTRNNVSIHHEDSREMNSIISQSIKTILNKEMMRIIKKVMMLMMMMTMMIMMMMLMTTLSSLYSTIVIYKYHTSYSIHPSISISISLYTSMFISLL